LSSHRLKCHPGPFCSTWNGDKLYEVRSEADRHFEVGDEVTLLEWVPPATLHTAECAARRIEAKAAGYLGVVCEGCPMGPGTFTGREIVATITSVTRDRWGLPGGLCVFGIRVGAVIVERPPREYLEGDEGPVSAACGRRLHGDCKRPGNCGCPCHAAGEAYENDDESDADAGVLH
jgi:hypothetical protein